MEKLQFELTNEQRKYLGLIPVEKSWQLVSLNKMFLYFDGDIIRKKITTDENSYLEQELAEKTAENRTILLPKTTKGKPKKLNYTATLSFKPFAVYFNFSGKHVSIANYTTQTTFHSEQLKEDAKIEDLKLWINKWISETTKAELIAIENFKTEKRTRCKYKEGDFFTFKINRKQWGFGRILIVVDKKKLKENKNYGLTNIPGKPLIVKIYHKISDSNIENFDDLENTLALPSQSVMDNNFYYGQYKIIGNKKLASGDLNSALISYGRSISGEDRETVYLQYGLIYKETTFSEFNKYLIKINKGGNDLINPHRNEGSGFGLYTDQLLNCIEAKSNKPFWDNASELDLRHPKSIERKREIFKIFGLNADKNYDENLKISNS